VNVELLCAGDSALVSLIPGNNFAAAGVLSAEPLPEAVRDTSRTG
jgi:hypothetical protein